VTEIIDQLPDEGVSPSVIAKYTKNDDRLYRLSDASGTMKFELVDSVNLTKSLLSSEDIFLVDNGAEIFGWIGKRASVDERRECVVSVSNYLHTTTHPYAPIAIYKEGSEPKSFWSLFTD